MKHTQGEGRRKNDNFISVYLSRLKKGKIRKEKKKKKMFSSIFCVLDILIEPVFLSRTRFHHNMSFPNGGNLTPNTPAEHEVLFFV